MPHLGYEKYQEFPGGISWRHQTGTYLCFVEVADAHKSAQNNRQGAGLNHLAFCGRDEAHLDELEVELRNREVKILKKNDYHICFEDPDGFAIEVFLN